MISRCQAEKTTEKAKKLKINADVKPKVRCIITTTLVVKPHNVRLIAHGQGLFETIW
jgi:hypothetical protein